MSVIPAVWKWKDHYKGSTFTPKNIKFNFDITGAVITCQLKASQGSGVIKEWKTNVNITVIDLLTGEIVLNQIDEFKPNAGSYIWDLQIKFSDGTGNTYLRGSQQVVQDITVTQ
jgi:hypothetical protein